MNETTSSIPLSETVNQWKTKKEIAHHYKCHVRTVTNFMRRRILPYTKIGRFVRFDPVACDRAMEKFTRASKF